MILVSWLIGHSLTFLMFLSLVNIFNTSKYPHIHRKESRVHLYYQRVAGVFWWWVMTPWKRPVILAVHGVHHTSLPILYTNPTGVRMVNELLEWFETLWIVEPGSNCGAWSMLNVLQYSAANLVQTILSELIFQCSLDYLEQFRGRLV